MVGRGQDLRNDRVGELRIVDAAVELGHRHGRRQGLLQRFREYRAQRRIVQMPPGCRDARSPSAHQERDRPLGAGDQAAHMLGQLLQFASFGAHRGNCLVVAVRAGWWRDVSDLAHG